MAKVCASPIFTWHRCAPPTRGELMTGYDAAQRRDLCLYGRALLRADLPTMADILAANGYHTGHFGKWHLGDNYPYRPQDRGFHETVHHPAFGITSAPDYFGNDYFDDIYRHSTVDRATGKKDDRLEQYYGYCTDVWFTEAIRWMNGLPQAQRALLCLHCHQRPMARSGCPMVIAKPISRLGNRSRSATHSIIMKRVSLA
ncbi:MAG: sulfatase-like hydrolase/transferase [Caldilineaceae bacterium]